MHEVFSPATSEIITRKKQTRPKYCLKCSEYHDLFKNGKMIGKDVRPCQEFTPPASTPKQKRESLRFATIPQDSSHTPSGTDRSRRPRCDPGNAAGISPASVP